MFKAQFKIRILYKSGNSHEFWADTFVYNFDGKSRELKWVSADHKNRPILIGVDDVEAIFQVGYRFRPSFEKLLELFEKK